MIDTAAAVRSKLRALAGVEPTGHALLSVVLSTSRLDDWRVSAPSFVRSEFNRQVQERRFPKEERRFLQAAFDYTLEVLGHEITPRTQGLALYLDEAGDYRERIELPVRLANHLVAEPRAYVRPVAQALSLLEPFVVAQVSRDESSLFLVDEWGVAEEDDLAGPWLRSSDPNTGEVSIKEYYAAARQDTLVELHYKEVGAALGKLLDDSPATRVVVCAQHDIASNFRRSLVQSVGSHVVAEIPFDAAATTAQMIATARPALERAHQEEVVALAARIGEALGRDGRGVAGFDEVSAALTRHQLQALLVDRAFEVPGWVCPACSWVGLARVSTCPACGGAPVPVSDAVGELVRLTILQGGRLVVGESSPALDQLGGVAGLLRYAV
jgi:peptide chain release factor subunit 1